MKQKAFFFKNALVWYTTKTDPAESRHQSKTRDVFQARLDHLFRELLKSGFHEPEAALLVSALGEIGNNAFDHNIGQWLDQPGCWFEYQIENKETRVVIADRGRGFLKSLRRVQVDLQSDQQVIETAFQKIISGRFPERRGNGLKYVRSIINGHPHRGLTVQSGKGALALGRHPQIPSYTNTLHQHTAQGVIAIMIWNTQEKPS